MIFTEITDDLTGAADSGSYFTARGQKLKICISGDTTLKREEGELLSVNLSSRNTKKEEARQLHRRLMEKILSGEEDYAVTNNRRREEKTVFMKKIGTGFRGNDPLELSGLLEVAEDYFVFIIDNAPDLGTFTLYGNQYCEGEILPKSLYAKDPVMPPTESFIPDILAHDCSFPIGLVDIDAVKGGGILEATQREIANGKRILVFDAVTKADTLRIVETLHPHYPRVFWTGSLGIADALAEHFYGSWQKTVFPIRKVLSFGFCASAYDICRTQLAYSMKTGLKVVQIDMDRLIEGDRSIPDGVIREALEWNRQEQNVMVVPRVNRYSYKPGTSETILEAVRELSATLCRKAVFDRLVVIGGETSQKVFHATGTEHLSLGRPLEPGVAQGVILDGVMAGREFALKGGSMGREATLDKMLCRSEVVY
ncbi:MAG: four-carbon acid sugar kinase family protein [Clostridiales bacterium]|nr:four-carbon acid sugar kinase family protein [Clostridiales bacterium]